MASAPRPVAAAEGDSAMSATGPLTPQLLPIWCSAAKRRDVPTAEAEASKSTYSYPGQPRAGCFRAIVLFVSKLPDGFPALRRWLEPKMGNAA